MAEGAVYPLDSRLRPDGEKGVLVTPLAAYREYFEKRAQFWEAQALTKARALYGPEREALDATVGEIWRHRCESSEIEGEIARMYLRIVKERAKGEPRLFFKTGKGGLIGIEFLVQSLQMKHQLSETNTLRAIEKLAGILDPNEIESLRGTYSFLRRVESVLRRVSNSSVSQLPSSADELRALSIRMGFEDQEKFLSDYTAARDRAETIIGKYLSVESSARVQK